jgi:thiol-disulfide isomerase/thioredoxin
MKILVFVSSNCPHCPKAERAVQRIVPDYYENGLIYKKVRVKTPEGKELSSRYGIRALPTILFLDENGKERGRKTGTPDEDVLRNDIEKMLGLKKSFFSRLFGGKDGS